MCGTAIDSGKSKKVYVDGVELTVCLNCFTKFTLKHTKREPSINVHQHTATHKSSTTKRSSTTAIKSTNKSSKEKKVADEKLELVEDYAEKIRRARESLGWDQRTLASRLKVSENIVKRIESGKLRPTIDLAKKLEEILGIKLLTPMVEEEVESSSVQKYVTLGEIVSVRGVKEKGH